MGLDTPLIPEVVVVLDGEELVTARSQSRTENQHRLQRWPVLVSFHGRSAEEQVKTKTILKTSPSHRPSRLLRGDV